MTPQPASVASESTVAKLKAKKQKKKHKERRRHLLNSQKTGRALDDDSDGDDDEELGGSVTPSLQQYANLPMNVPPSGSTSDEDGDNDDDDDDDDIEEEGDVVADLQNSFRRSRVLLVVPLEDASDAYFQEDPYVYSDDSGSLPETYFFPQHEGASMVPSTGGDHADGPAKFAATSYGSIEPSRQYRKRSKRYSRKLLQEQRERAVTKIRGKPQPPTSCNDTFWLLLFIFQLLFVFGCSIRYGYTLMQPTPFFQQFHNIWHTTGTMEVASLPLLSRSNNKNNPSTKNYTVPFSSSSPISFNTTSKKTPRDIQPLRDDDSFQLDDPKGGMKMPSIQSSATQPPAPPKTTTFNDDNKNSFAIDYQNVITLLFFSGIYACVTSYLSLGFMLIIARSLIPIMLIFTILLALFWGVFGWMVVSCKVFSFLGFGFFVFALGYALACWNRIPFCSTNLFTAICAIRNTTGILLVGIGSLWIALSWCLIWAIAVMGIVNSGSAHSLWNSDRATELAILMVSFYWTNMVIKNVVRVTVAGAIGAWWFAAPQPTSCWDASVWYPLQRSSTYSLGSICFGSLVVLPAQILSVLSSCCCWMAGAGRYQDASVAAPTKKSENGPYQAEGDGVTNDALNKECVGLTDRLGCCNRWAYTYIGMYGYSFAQGGEMAIQLFETREWMDIVQDNLIHNILVVASIVIGASAGVFAVLLEEVDGYTFTSLHQPMMTAFWIGSIIGFCISNILLLGVVGSAVNTILVCFAADPFEFDKNHPRLSREMREVWSQQVWEPNEDTV